MVNSGPGILSPLSVEVGSLIVPGAGIEPVRGPEGKMSLPSRQTALNAITASGIMFGHPVVEMALLAGDGSDPNKSVYGAAEKELMAGILHQRLISRSRIWVDSRESSTSWENLRGDAGPFVEEFGHNPIGIVAHPGHNDRFVYFAGKIFGSRREFVPIAAGRASLLGLIAERAKTARYQFAFRGAQTVEEMDERHDRLQTGSLGFMKKALRKAGSSRY